MSIKERGGPKNPAQILFDYLNPSLIKRNRNGLKIAVTLNCVGVIADIYIFDKYGNF